MRKSFRLIAVIMLLLAAMTLCDTTWAQDTKGETTLYVVGTGRINGEDLAAGREEAMKNGHLMAVSRVLGDLMPPETMAVHFKVLNESILSHTDPFVQDYKVLNEFTGPGTYRLLIQATLSTQRLKAALQKAGVRLGQIPYPRVLLCLSEKSIQDDAPRYWWSGQTPSDGVASAALAKLLSEKGYLIVKPGTLGAASYPQELSAADAAAIGQQLQADVVITGIATSEEAANTMAGSVRSYRGSLTATAIRAADAQIMAQSQHAELKAGNDPAAAGREALMSAASLAGEDLSAQISTLWFKHSSSTSAVELVVQGVGGNIANFVKFRGALSGTSGVNNLQLKEMMSGTAILNLEYQGTAESLADALLLLEFDSFGINIDSVEATAIKLRLTPKPEKATIK
jgi:hypothetical protein